MSIYAQHGYGKSTKIDEGLKKGYINGVIFSPRDEKPDNIKTYLETLSRDYKDIDLLFDPQVYASTLHAPRDGYLPEYPYYKNNLSRKDLRFSEISQIVEKTLNYQSSLNLTKIISPTISFSSFQDVWSEISNNLAEESINQYEKANFSTPLLISLIIDEEAFKDKSYMDEFLDIVTTYEAKGFYLIINRKHPQYSPQFEDQKLNNIMYFIYSLRIINEFEIIAGYTDLVGILFHALDVSSTACGWFNGLRQFTFDRFLPSTGGKRPNPRYTSLPLLNTIQLRPDLHTIFENNYLNEVLSGSSFDHIISTKTGNFDIWSMNDCILQHWESLSEIAKRIKKIDDFYDRLDYIQKMIKDSSSLYDKLKLKNIGINLNQLHLEQWKNAITGFKDLIK